MQKSVNTIELRVMPPPPVAILSLEPPLLGRVTHYHKS